MKTSLLLLMVALSAQSASLTVGKAKTLHAVSTNANRTLCGYWSTNAIGTNAVTCKLCIRAVAKGGAK